MVSAAAGMGAGLPKFNAVNLDDLAAFQDDEVVTIEALEEKRILNLSGRQAGLPLKVRLHTPQRQHVYRVLRRLTQSGWVLTRISVFFRGVDHREMSYFPILTHPNPFVCCPSDKVGPNSCSVMVLCASLNVLVIWQAMIAESLLPFAYTEMLRIMSLDGLTIRCSYHCDTGICAASPSSSGLPTYAYTESVSA